VDAGRDVGAWEAVGKEHFDVALAFVRCGLKKVGVVFVREVIAEELESGEVDGTGREEGKDYGEAAAEAGREDAAVGFTLTHAEACGAVVEHRGVAHDEVEAALLDFGEADDELGRELPVGADERRDGREELLVRAISGWHELEISCEIGPLRALVCRGFDVEITSERVGDAKAHHRAVRCRWRMT
jgi:hypothetical protein